MDNVLSLGLPIILSTIASSGFWIYILKRFEKQSLSNKLLLGLAHDRIVHVCMDYINKGCLTHNEYESLHKYLYTPYIDMGGNGLTKKFMARVDRLPIAKNKQACVQTNKKEQDHVI